MINVDQLYLMSFLYILYVSDKIRADVTIKNTATLTSEREPPLQMHQRRSY